MKKLALILLLLGALGAASQLWKHSPTLIEAVSASPLLNALTGVVPGTGQHQMTSADALLGQLPGLQGWRTFAKPLPLGGDSLLLFQRVGSGAVVWRIDWKRNKVSSFPLPELQLQKDGRYTALSSEDGVWLLGEKTILIRPTGERLVLDTGFNEPVAVVLDDQSVLVLGPALHGTTRNEQYRMQQLSVSFGALQLRVTDRGLLSYDGRPNEAGQTYRIPSYGHSAAKLRDGRVLLLGGDRTPTFASLIEPRSGEGSWSVKPVAPMPNERKFAATMVMPDGRVVVTGAPHLRCYGEAKSARSVDVFDVQNNSWSSLPALPFVPCSDAYGADTPAIAFMPDGALVVGAYLEPQVMVLARDGASPTGYAASWRVHGRMPLRRISGVLQVLSDQEVVVAGGVDIQRGAGGGCCYATSGFDLVSIAENETADSLAMSFIGAGVARRGQSLFAGGGRRFGSTGFGQMRYSAYAELVDLATGKARQLPNIPFATGAAQAVWLDDERVLFKGAKEASSNGFTPDVPSYTPPSSADMAIFHVRENRWSEPISIRELERAQIAAAEGDKVLLLGAGGQPVRLDLSTRKLELLQAEHGLTDGIARLLPQGQLVIAGGYVPSNEPRADCASEPEPDFDAGEIAESPEGESDAVAELAPECRQQPDEEVPEADGASVVPTAMVEVLSLDQAVPAQPSSPGARGPANVTSTVITGEGQTIALSRNPETREASMAHIGLGGKEWESMSLPPELAGSQTDSCGRCALIVAPDPRNNAKDLVFLRQGAIDADWVDDDIGEQGVNVWWWDEAAKGWHRVLQGKGISTRSAPLALGEPLSSTQGKRMMSMGWHLREPVLWMEP